MSNDDLLLPQSINIFIAVQAGGLFWILNSFLASTVAFFFVGHHRLTGNSSIEAVSSSVKSLLQAVVVPLNTIISYVSALVQFLVSNVSWVFFAAFVSMISFLLLNYQQALIVLIDDTYENVYPVVIFPIKGAVNFFVMIMQIGIGLINFVSAYTSAVFIDSSSLLMQCPGYFPNIYYHFSNVASSLAALATSSASLFANKLVGPLELRTVFKPLRLMTYDALLRMQCACPADRGVVDIFETGLFDATSVNVESLIHYAVNSIISIPQIVFATVSASATSGTYVAPNTDYVFDQLVGLTNYSEYISNAILINGVGFIEGLITQATSGRSSVPWPAIPIFSIPGRMIVFSLEITRVVIRTLVNAPDLFNPRTFANRGYQLLDGRFAYQAQLDISNAIWYQNFGAIYRNVLKKPGLAIRDGNNIFFAHTYWFWEIFLRMILGRSAGTPYRYGAPPFTGICTLPSDEVFSGGFKNFWSGVYDVVGEYDRLVKTAFETFASSLNVAFAPYYPPLAMSGGLGTIAFANYQSLMMRKNIYILYSMMTFTPPSYVCVNSLGRGTRIAVDNLIESLGDFTNFFLNINQAQDLRNAHFNCRDSNVQNYVYIGSLKSHYFATKMCNTKYTDGTLLQCDYINAADCPDYAVAYSDLNVNLLCAANEVIVQFMKTALINFRIANMYAEKQFIKQIACLIAPTNTTTCPKNDGVSLQQTVQTAAVSACAAQEVVVKLSNVISAIFAFGYDFAYQNFFGYGYVNGGTVRGNTRIAYNEMKATAPEIQSFLESRSVTNDPMCSSTLGCCTSAGRQASVVACVNGGSTNVCQWDGTRCTMMSAQHLTFQQYPLEAATSTLLISVFSAGMWGNYLAFQNGVRLAKNMEIDYTLPIAQAYGEMITRFYTMMQTDKYFVVLEAVRIGVLASRDIIIAMVEFIRTFIFVFEGGRLPAQFVEFERVMIKIVDFIENFAMIVVNDGFEVLFAISQFVMDFVSMVFDPSNAENAMKDALQQLNNIVQSQLTLFKKFVLMIPGIDQICKFFEDMVRSVMGGIGSMVNGAIIPILNKLISVLNGLQSAMVNGLNSLVSQITDLVNSLIAVAVDAINVVIGGIQAAGASVNTAVSGIQTAFNWLGRRRQLLFSLTIPALGTIPSLSPVSLSSPIQCPASFAQPRPTSASMCSFNSDCTRDNSYCIVNHISQCNEQTWFSDNLVGGINMNDMWAKPCACNQLTTQNSFCNFASGFCQEGISPFGDPLSSCPADGIQSFVESTDYYNAMCWLYPAWKCSATSDESLTACIQTNLNSAKPSVTGPHLCRDFCSPSLFNMDNRLVSHPKFGCVCAVGWSVGSNQPQPDLAASLLKGVGATVMSSRHLLEDDPQSAQDISDFMNSSFPFVDRTAYNTFFDWQYADPHYHVILPTSINGSTFCAEDNDCLVPTTMCDSYDGRRACSSCPMRNFFSDGSGHACLRGRCVCDAIPSTPHNMDFSKIAWAGTSRCSLLGRAYSNETEMSTLAYVELRACSYKHLTGLALRHTLRMPTLNPAIMYDNMELARFGAHLSAGIAVGCLFHNESDQRLWTIFSKLSIDPNIGLPATRMTLGFVNTTRHAFPKTVNMTYNAVKFSVNMFGVFYKLPRYGEVRNATKFIGSTTTNAFYAAAGFYNSSTAMQSVYDEIAEFRRNVSEWSDYESRRRLLATVNVMPLSCPILANFVVELGKTSKNLVTQLTVNVPRSVCRMNNPKGGDAWTACPAASWQLPLPAGTPPPPAKPPPPVLAYPPPPSSIKVLLTKPVSKGGFIQQFIFGAILGISGFDASAWINAQMDSVLTAFPTKTSARTKVTDTVRSLQCTYDTAVMCRTKTKTLLYHIVALTAQIFAAVLISSFLKLSFFTPALIATALVMFFPTVMSRTYGMPIGCSLSYTPVLPVCLAEDFQDLLYQLLPRHIPWPAPLVNTHNRVPQSIPIGTGRPIQVAYIQTADVQDCSAFGFGDGIRELIFVLDYFAPSWRSYVTTVTTSTFFGWDFTQELTYFQGKAIHEKIYEQCATLFAVTAIPLLLFAFVVLVFSVALLHVAFLFARHVLVAVRDIYYAVANLFIDMRDSAP
jgi:hypothetical protein